VIGSVGPGKTRFARALAKKLGVPHVEIAAPQVRLRSARAVRRYLEAA
jgi:adenylate kinase family enzyme